jgi:rubrerythrin
MKSMTEGNLRSAFAGESQAHMRYLIYADKAEKEGKSNLARLFKAIAYSEQVHATNHFNTLGENKSLSENLQNSINGETYEVNEMYPSFLEVAKYQEEKRAQKSIMNAFEAEKVHSKMYEKAKKTIDEGKDTSFNNIYVCEVCGYTIEDTVPDRCPVCNAPREKFRKF